MRHAIFIVGLPGSGKTHYANELSKELSAELFDDFKNNAVKNCQLFPFARKFVDLVIQLRNNSVCIICDIDFCDSDSREDAQTCLQELVSDLEVEWQYFENNPEQCKQNIVQRSQKENREVDKELDNLRRYAEKYQIPENTKILQVWRDN